MASSQARCRRPRRSPEEALRLVRSWRRSGLSQRAFAEKEGLAPGTLAYWVHRSRGKGDWAGRATPGDPPRLVEVQLPADPDPLEVSFPNGVRVRVPARFDREDLRFILRELSAEGHQAC